MYRPVLLYGILIIVIQMSQIFSYRLGIENISPRIASMLKNKVIGLVTNQSSVDQKGNRTIDILLHKKISIRYIFTTEHGMAGTCGAGKVVHDDVDPKTGIPVVGLYTPTGIEKKLLNTVDLFIFDVQDVGMRHFTHIALLYHLMQYAAEHKKEIVIFDRPNVLGRQIEGPLVEESLKSFISVASIPVRYGLTIGELARLFNKQIKPTALLTVVPLCNYNPCTMTPSLLTPLSPNIPDIQAAYGYSFLGLLGEIRPFDVGIGTSQAFQCLLLPEDLQISDTVWDACAALCQQHAVASTPYRYFSTRKKKWLKGLSFMIVDIARVPSFALLIALLTFFKEHVTLTFSGDFDKAVGTALVRQCLQEGSHPDILCGHVRKQTDWYYEQIADCLLYAR